MTTHGSKHGTGPKFALDLTKSAQVLRLELDKAGVPSRVKAEIIFIMDVSRSFEHEHEEGTTSVLVQRLAPLAMELDPDGLVDFMVFSDGPDNVEWVGTINPRNSANYIVDRVVERVRGWNGGTTYSYALEEALKRLGWIECDHDHAEGGFSRFWRNLIGAPVEPHMHEQKRSIIVFITDGENDPDGRYGDKERTIRVLQDSQDRGDKVYYLVLGACEHAQFEYVREIAKRFRNTGIVMATNPEEFVELPDDQLMALLLGPELIEWLKS